MRAAGGTHTVRGWSRLAAGWYERPDGYRILNSPHDRYPDRPWLVDRKRRDLPGGSTSWDQVGRYHTLLLAKLAADREETQ